MMTQPMAIGILRPHHSATKGLFIVVSRLRVYLSSLSTGGSHDEETDNGSNVVRIVHDTQAVVVGLVEVVCPSVHLLR
jgi:hypothetical protein